jgi:hypothetical protein
VLDGVDTPQSVLATECPASRADGLLREIAAVRDVRAVSDVRSTRSARSPDLGTVSFQAQAGSREALATLLRQAWPLGRVVIGVPPHPDDQLLHGGWLDRDVEPPAELRARYDLIAVSFFHGDWLGLYGAGAGPSTLNRLDTIAARLGQPIDKATQPF